jgi:hypothetical protein
MAAPASASSPLKSFSRVGLVQLCASHINSERRVGRLRIMLESWSKQTQQVPMYLSISFASDVLKKLALAILKERPRTAVDLVVLCNKTPKSQFQHYQQLAARVSQEQHTSVKMWCIFTDDDDESHPERTASYVYALSREVQAGTLAAASCVFEEEQAATQAQYAAAFAKTKQADTSKLGRDREYFHYCVRVCTLVDFCTRVHPAILAHPFADTMFARYLQCPETRARLVSFTPKQALLVQYDGDATYVRSRTDPWVPLLQAAQQAMAVAPAAERHQAIYAVNRLELLRMVCSFAAAYYPSANTKEVACPAWSHFLSDSRMIIGMGRALQGLPQEAPADLLFADDEAGWQVLYEELIRNDPEFRSWLDSPRYRQGMS